jgi:HEAT repeat protein
MRALLRVDLKKLGRVGSFGWWRSWGLWNLVYPQTGDLARAGDVDGLLRRLERAEDPPEGQVSERAVIASALGRLRAQAAIPRLAPLVEPDNPVDVRGSASAALRQIGGPQAARALLSALDDERYGVRRNAIYAVAPFADDEITAKIADLAAASPQLALRLDAIAALGDIKNDGAVPVLLRVAQTDQHLVAIMASTTLLQMKTPASRLALTRLEQTRYRQLIRLARRLPNMHRAG